MTEDLRDLHQEGIAALHALSARVRHTRVGTADKVWAELEAVDREVAAIRAALDQLVDPVGAVTAAEADLT